MAGFRPDEAAEIHTRLQRSRPDLLDEDWEQNAVMCEQAIALAAWRSQPMTTRVQALTDAMLIFHQPDLSHIKVTTPARRTSPRNQ